MKDLNTIPAKLRHLRTIERYNLYLELREYRELTPEEEADFEYCDLKVLDWASD